MGLRGREWVVEQFRWEGIAEPLRRPVPAVGGIRDGVRRNGAVAATGNAFDAGGGRTVKDFLKATANGIAWILVLPAVAMYHVSACLGGRERVFPGWSEGFSLLPGLPGIYLRRAFYRLVLGRCGKDACLRLGVLVSHPTARIGRSVYVGPFSHAGSVTIEDDVLVGSHVTIMNGGPQHAIDRLDIPVREQPGVFLPITIGCDTWIGERAVIQANVGRHCVIGAGSVVTKDVPDYAIAVGVPARVIRYRNQGRETEANVCPNTPTFPGVIPKRTRGCDVDPWHDQSGTYRPQGNSRPAAFGQSARGADGAARERRPSCVGKILRMRVREYVRTDSWICKRLAAWAGFLAGQVFLWIGIALPCLPVVDGHPSSGLLRRRSIAGSCRE